MYTKKEKALINLSLCNTISNKKLHIIIEKFDLEKLYDNVSYFKQELLKIINENEFNSLTLYNDKLYFDNYIKNLANAKITAVTLFSKSYPITLKNTDSPPIVLYCKGNIELLNEPCLAIVGTRRCTKYGEETTKKIASAVAINGIVVVSGLAEGVDTAAHIAALDVKGKTIAVLGCGVNEIFPESNAKLKERIILNGGLIVSEYKPNEKAQSFYFPMRNRIVAGLSKAVVITEATEKSGTMYTKDYALDYGRELFAVPGRVNDIYSKGCNKIIKSCQASILTDVNEILNTYGLTKDQKLNSKNTVQLSLDDDIVFKIIANGEIHFDEILLKCKLDTKALNTILTRLQIKGLIQRLPGNIFSR